MRISIITVVYNGMPYLTEAIKSVISQKMDEMEYIVIDGGSTDGSKEVIKKYERSIDKWVSEPDSGIYDAMNKGISMAEGDIIGILNADDVLNTGVIELITKTFNDKGNLDYVYGYVQRMSKSGVVYGNATSLSQSEMESNKFKQIPIPHGALFVKKELIEELGYYRTDYKINSDYDFILKLIQNQKKGLQLNLAISKYRDGGRSSGFLTFWERRTLLKRYGVSRLYREWIVGKAISKLFLAKLMPKRILSIYEVIKLGK